MINPVVKSKSFIPLEKVHPVRRKFSNRVKGQSSLTGITLLELILSMVLLSIIILAASSIDIATKTFFNSSSRKTSALNSASLSLETIQKYVLQSHGWIDDKGFDDSSNDRLWIRIDNESNPTPGTFSDDIWVRYLYNSNNHELRFCDNCGSGSGTAPNLHPAACNCQNPEIILSNQVTSCTFIPVAGKTGVYVNITTRFDPNKPPNEHTNPQDNLQGTFYYGCHSF